MDKRSLFRLNGNLIVSSTGNNSIKVFLDTFCLKYKSLDERMRTACHPCFSHALMGLINMVNCHSGNEPLDVKEYLVSREFVLEMSDFFSGRYSYAAITFSYNTGLELICAQIERTGKSSERPAFYIQAGYGNTLETAFENALKSESQRAKLIS